MGGVSKDTTLRLGMSVPTDVSKRAKRKFKHAGFKNPLHKNKKNMKSEMKFNHDAESMTEALGVSQSPDEVAMAVSQTVQKWSEDKSKHKSVSLLSEYLHKNLSYEIILMIATRDVHNKIEQLMTESIADSEVLNLLKSLDIKRQTREN